MDQQVSPAVVVIVLILIAAILVGLYFLVVDRKSQATEEPPADVTAGEATPPVDIDAGAEPAADTAGVQESADQTETQPAETGGEPTDAPAPTEGDQAAEGGASGAAPQGGGG